MGRGIAQWAASAGHTVELGDVRPEAVTDALEFVASMLDRAVAKGRILEPPNGTGPWPGWCRSPSRGRRARRWSW